MYIETIQSLIHINGAVFTKCVVNANLMFCRFINCNVPNTRLPLHNSNRRKDDYKVSLDLSSYLHRLF